MFFFRGDCGISVSAGYILSRHNLQDIRFHSYCETIHISREEKQILDVSIIIGSSVATDSIIHA